MFLEYNMYQLDLLVKFNSTSKSINYLCTTSFKYEHLTVVLLVELTLKSYNL
jgi:hypothetical protein